MKKLTIVFSSVPTPHVHEKGKKGVTPKKKGTDY